jgi:hypothetical protein
MSIPRHTMHVQPAKQDNPAIAVILAQSMYIQASRAQPYTMVHRHGSGRQGLRINAAYASCVYDALRRIV